METIDSFKWVTFVSKEKELAMAKAKKSERNLDVHPEYGILLMRKDNLQEMTAIAGDIQSYVDVSVFFPTSDIILHMCTDCLAASIACEQEVRYAGTIDRVYNHYPFLRRNEAVCNIPIRVVDVDTGKTFIYSSNEEIRPEC
ncbi:hypothetical protein COOONC_05904 [Cooperia oncophora]